ncbi:MAG: hypothetical protein VST68_04640 [Nitrospirota bacterium]|nr:hypothetical protein [Nitrospirota bacterium]
MLSAAEGNGQKSPLFHPPNPKGAKTPFFHGQGRSLFGARSVLPVREHGKMARTPLAAFFNIPHIAGAI